MLFVSIRALIVYFDW